MKRLKSFALSYNMLPYSIAVLNFIIALTFCIAFFCIVKNMPETIPVHWSQENGIDKWGAKSELYSVAIIPTVFAGITLPSSIALIRKNYNGFAYLFNGISLTLTLIMIFTAVFMLSL